MKTSRKLIIASLALLVTVSISGCLAITNPTVANTENYAKSLPTVEKTSIESRMFSFGANGTAYTIKAYMKSNVSLKAIYDAQKGVIARSKPRDPEVVLVYHGVSIPVETPKAAVAFLYRSLPTTIAGGAINLSPIAGYESGVKFKYIEIEYLLKDKASMLAQAAKLVTYPEVQSGVFVVNVGAPNERYMITGVSSVSRTYATAKALEHFPQVSQYYISDLFVHVEVAPDTSKQIIDEITLTLQQIKNTPFNDGTDGSWEIQNVGPAVN